VSLFAERPLTRTRVWTCVLINQFATPGLGSLMARRLWAGTGQLLAVVGCVLITGWMCALFYRVFQEQLGGPVSQNSFDWLWQWGTVLFGAGWLWSGVTSISLLRRTKPEKMPPKLADLPETGKS
jgi:hypothetical protein